ncbi:MAG TPA: hypothetical protein VFR89_06280 [candidate division Zixibacteria bacterium]|nr:hypothetical protein [candidate division Zixibacteria bacterium]
MRFNTKTLSALLLLFAACSSGPGTMPVKLDLPIPTLEEGRRKQNQLKQGQMLWQLDPAQTVRTYAADLGIAEALKDGDLRVVKNEPMLAAVELSATGFSTTRIYLAKLLDAPENRPSLWFVVAAEKVEKKK